MLQSEAHLISEPHLINEARLIKAYLCTVNDSQCIAQLKYTYVFIMLNLLTTIQKKPATRCGQNINHVECDERWEGANRVLVTRPGFNDSVANVVFFKVLFKVVD